MTVQEFKAKYAGMIHPYNQGEPAFEDNMPLVHVAEDMLKDAFPILSDCPLIVSQILLGKCDRDRFGGLGTTYGNSALSRVYEGIIFALETGYFEIGLDKCNIISETPAPLFAVQLSESKWDDAPRAYIVNIFTTNKTFILADSGSHYKKLLVKGLNDFVEVVNTIVKNEGTFDLNGWRLSCDDAEYLNDGFCAADRNVVLSGLNTDTSTPKIHVGHFCTNGKRVSSDENGSELWVDRTELNKFNEVAYNPAKICYGSKPFMMANDCYDGSKVVAIYQNQIFHGTEKDLKRWANKL